MAKLKELEESRDELQAVNMEAAKRQEQLSIENAHLKGEIDSLNLLVKAAEDSLDAEKAGLKRTVKETNIKVNRFWLISTNEIAKYKNLPYLLVNLSLHEHREKVFVDKK